MPTAFFDGLEEYPGGTGPVGVGLYGSWVRDGGGGGTNNVVAGIGRFGGRCVEQNANATASALYRIIPNTTQVSWAMAWKVTTLGTQSLMSIRGGSNVHITVSVDDAGRFTVTAQSGVLGVSAPKIVPTAWFFLNLEVNIHDSTGSVLLRFNGETILDITNVDTKHNSSADADRIMVHRGGNLGTTHWDDVRVDYDTTDYIPEGRAVKMLADSTITGNFTPLSVGDNHLMINESIVDSDTTYVSGTTVGLIDEYGYGALPFNPETIQLVQLSIAARKDDAATRRLQPFVRSGAVRDNAPDFYLGETYEWRRHIMPLDPDGDVAWTIEAVNALQAGHELLE